MISYKLNLYLLAIFSIVENSFVHFSCSWSSPSRISPRKSLISKNRYAWSTTYLFQMLKFLLLVKKVRICRPNITPGRKLDRSIPISFRLLRKRVVRGPAIFQLCLSYSMYNTCLAILVYTDNKCIITVKCASCLCLN